MPRNRCIIERARNLQPGVIVKMNNGNVKKITARYGPRIHWTALPQWGKPIIIKRGACWDYMLAMYVDTILSEPTHKNKLMVCDEIQ